MKRESPAKALLVAAGTLLFLELLCFGPHLAKTGFYLDDWVFLDRAFGAGNRGLLGAIRAFCTPDFASRPLEILHFAVLTAAGGLSPWRYRAVNLIGELLLGLALFSTLRGLSVGGRLSLLAAGLALLYPNHSSTHLWMSQSPQTWAMALCFGAFAAHLRWALPRPGAAKSGVWLLLSQACYLASLLMYESTFFLPLALAAGLWVAGPGSPRLSLEQGRAWLKTMLPFAVSAGLFVLYQRVLAPMWLAPSPKRIDLSLAHAWSIYRAAASCSTAGVLELLQMVRPPVASAAWWAALPAGAALAGVFLGAEDPDESGSKTGRRALWAFGAGLFISAYLPYAFTQGYVPRVFGVLNRVNMGGGLGAGVLAAALLGVLPSWRASWPRRTAAAVLFASFGLSHWMSGWVWMKAWDMQREVLREIEARLPSGPATIVLRGTRPHLLGAPLFRTHYDASRALWLRTGRRDIAVNWAKKVSFDPVGLGVVNGDGNFFRYPYAGLFFYDGPSRRLVPVTGPRD